MLDRVSALLERCAGNSSVVPPTTLYNEGWLLRLFLDWFDLHREAEHPLSFLPGARWYSEALLAPPFLPESRGDNRAESYTHADGIIGHFDIQPGERGEAILRKEARQFVVLEAKLGSGLSSGVKNAPGYDQAARNVACIVNAVEKTGRAAESVERFAFYVVAPESNIRAGVFGDMVTRESIRRKVLARTAQYNGARDAWFTNTFEPMLRNIDCGLITWESLLDFLPKAQFALSMGDFYSRCLKYNRWKKG